MISRRYSNDVLRELPVSSIDSDSNIGVALMTSSPERTPRVPIHALGGEGPFCSPVQYVYATGRTRRRLELDTGHERPPSPLFDDFRPECTSTPGPSTRSSRSRSPSKTPCSSRKRHATQTSDYYSRLDDSEESILQESVSWLKRAKKSRRDRIQSQSGLPQRLRALTSDQLANVVSDLVRHHPDLEEDLHAILPEPDISLHEEKISELLHNVYRAMPRHRLSSTRSAFCYRRVRLHIIAFKKQCIMQGRHFLGCRAWGAAIKYVLAAWQHVHKLPVWECPAHNRLKVTCFHGLAGICVEALRKGEFSRQALEEFRPRIEQMCHTAPDMKACLQRLNLMTETSPEA